MKIVFMGTPDFAATILKAVDEAGHEILAVYTQPDRPKGRSGKPVQSPVKEYAVSKGYKVFQPEKIRKPEEVEILKTFDADVFVVAAFGQILSQEILDIPKICPINAHGSLLPHLRGASPIQRAIAMGESETGVTIQRMDAGIDTGDIIDAVTVPIEDTDDETSMYEKLAIEGAKLTVKVLKSLSDNTATYKKQDESLASYAPMLKKEEGLLDLKLSAKELDARVRGFKEWPTVYTYIDGKLLKVYKTRPVDEIQADNEKSLEAGTFFVTKKNIYIKTAKGYLELLEVQPEGKKRMPAIDFARGAHIVTGTKINS